MRKSIAFLSILNSMFSSTEGEEIHFSERKASPPKKSLDERLEERARRKGLQKFTIDGQTIYALNEKNARRKLGLA